MSVLQPYIGIDNPNDNDGCNQGGRGVEHDGYKGSEEMALLRGKQRNEFLAKFPKRSLLPGTIPYLKRVLHSASCFAASRGAAHIRAMSPSVPCVFPWPAPRPP